jgi:hypothetical protein
VEPTSGASSFQLKHFARRRLNQNFLESVFAVQTFIDTETEKRCRPKLRWNEIITPSFSTSKLLSSSVIHGTA